MAHVTINQYIMHHMSSCGRSLLAARSSVLATLDYEKTTRPECHVMKTSLSTLSPTWRWSLIVRSHQSSLDVYNLRVQQRETNTEKPDMISETISAATAPNFGAKLHLPSRCALSGFCLDVAVLDNHSFELGFDFLFPSGN